MLSDKELINLMVYEPSWEDVIVKIIAEEQMDPWNIDIVKLTDVFVEYLGRIDKLDLRIPARFILISAVLIRMKSDILVERKPRILVADTNDKDSELMRILSQIPPLDPPLKRMPMRNVPLEDLLHALKKAFEVEERRGIRKERYKKAVKDVLTQEPDDINKRIDILLDYIQETLKDIEDNIEFSRLVKQWSKKEIVKTLLPLLHLSQEGKIKVRQKELFKEIYVKKREKEEA